MEIKKILRQYTFSLVVIFCVGAFFLGTVSVREKTRYNMDMTPYDEIKIENTAQGIIVHYGEKEYMIRTDYAEKIRQRLDIASEEGIIFDFRQIFT